MRGPTGAGLALVALCAGSAAADELRFQCSWDNRKPIEIVVDTTAARATRDDGGNDYRVIKVSDFAVWLLVDQPENQAGAAVQVIERGAAQGGRWLDVILAASGAVSPIIGGVCWED